MMVSSNDKTIMNKILWFVFFLKETEYFNTNPAEIAWNIMFGFEMPNC